MIKTEMKSNSQSLYSPIPLHGSKFHSIALGSVDLCCLIFDECIILHMCCLHIRGGNHRIPHDTILSRYMAHDNDNITMISL